MRIVLFILFTLLASLFSSLESSDLFYCDDYFWFVPDHSDSVVTWEEAKSICLNRGMRLPTQAELKLFFKNCVKLCRTPLNETSRFAWTSKEPYIKTISKVEHLEEGYFKEQQTIKKSKMILVNQCVGYNHSTAIINIERDINLKEYCVCSSKTKP